MKKDVHLPLLVAIVFLALLPSCKTQVPKYNYAELAKAAVRLHIDIDMNDNHRLYIESARWIGVPYRHGGNSKRGIDCSGLTSNIVKAVYNKQLERNSDLQRKKNCRKIVAVDFCCNNKFFSCLFIALLFHQCHAPAGICIGISVRNPVGIFK